jgi:hypothetical protein
MAPVVAALVDRAAPLATAATAFPAAPAASWNYT